MPVGMSPSLLRRWDRSPSTSNPHIPRVAPDGRVEAFSIIRALLARREALPNDGGKKWTLHPPWPRHDTRGSLAETSPHLPDHVDS